MKKKIYLLCCAVFFVCFSFHSDAQIITTIAGTVASGYSGDGAAATAAQLFHPKGTVTDDTGNVYIADADNNVIRKINLAGTISTFAGLPAGGYGGDGALAIFALLSRPNSIAIDHHHNMYICDADNHCVRKINTAGIITTIAGDGTPGFLGDGMPATAAEMDFPGSIALDDTGNVYVADEYNNRIRKIDTFGIMTTFAGNGLTGYAGEGGNADTATIGFPFGVAVDHAGNVYFSLTLGNRICKVNTSHIITTVAGTGGPGAFSGDGGPATAAEFDTPWGIATDPAGNVYITDNANERIRKLDVTTGFVSTVAGNGSAGFFGDGSAATAAKLRDPAGVYVDGAGNMYIADYNNHRVRKVGTALTHPPMFTGGHSQSLTVCENVPPVSIDTLLAVIDSDAGQSENWTVISGPSHGTLVATYSTISTGSVLVPTGLSYAPTAGYTGADSFKVRVADGTGSDSTTVHVSVVSCAEGLVTVEGTNEHKIFPNPNEGEFTISVYSGSEGQAQITIMNLVGKKIKELTIPTNVPVQVQLHEPPGAYILQAATTAGKWYEKVMIVK